MQLGFKCRLGVEISVAGGEESRDEGEARESRGGCRRDTYSKAVVEAAKSRTRGDDIGSGMEKGRVKGSRPEAVDASTNDPIVGGVGLGFSGANEINASLY